MTKPPHDKTPLNPSKKAIARVRNPLPVPKCCPNCQGPVSIVNNREIYGREYGDWPWAYRCDSRLCDSYVGMHPFTDIPLGSLADRPTRSARNRAKDAFNPLHASGGMTRTAAYHWLAGMLGIADPNKCHIGWMDIAQCDKVVYICKNRKV